MIERHRTPSRRAYSLPGWFFFVAVAASVLGLAGAVHLLGPDSVKSSTRPTPRVTASVMPSTRPSTNQPDRRDVDVVVLNASDIPGLAARVAKDIEKAGWTVSEVGNWTFGAGQNAVYFPDGLDEKAELLAQDLDIATVKPVTPAMSTTELTVLLLRAP